jgi:ABC-type uncharacterized transport system involved in gliding motility auxiliary subunit
MSTTTHSRPVLRAVLGIAALVVIVFLANWLMNLSSAGKKGLDLTEDKIHTLSEGTKSILQDLDAPVVVRYYATRKSEAISRDLKLYMRKVEDFLKQYAVLSDGKLRLEFLDPQPDTDAEDSANLDGMRGERIVDGSYEENIFHGVSISCLDKKQTIPFLSPNDETRLEYELSRAIAQVSQTKKPIVGLMSALNLPGGPAAMPGQRPTPPWAIYQQLSQSYEIRILGMQPGPIDPEEITVLLLLHPAGITPAAEFQVDQYLLKGGTVVACLDPYSVAAQMTTPPPNPMMGGGPQAQTSSTLPTLLKSWGIEFPTTEVLADSKYRTPLGDGRIGMSLLSLTQEAMPNRKKDLTTQSLVDLFFVMPGGFTVKGGKGMSSSSLVRSSRQSALVNSFQASQLDQSLVTGMRPDEHAYDLVLRLAGSFKSAFPEGDPDKPSAGTEDTEGTEGGKDPAVDGSLKEASEPGSVFLISDVDFVFDQFAYRPMRVGNTQIFTPNNGNSVLLFNILDQATGSKHLIGSRSRASTRRPFTLVQEMEARFEQKVGDKIDKLENQKTEIQAKVDDLQSQKAAGTEMFLSPEQVAEEKKWRSQIGAFNKDIRELQKDLKREKDALSSYVTMLNVLVIPLIVAIIGIIVQMRRRSITEAR